MVGGAWGSLSSWVSGRVPCSVTALEGQVVGKVDLEGDLLPEWLPGGSEHSSCADWVSAEIRWGPEHPTSERESSRCERELAPFRLRSGSVQFWMNFG